MADALTAIPQASQAFAQANPGASVAQQVNRTGNMNQPASASGQPSAQPGAIQTPYNFVPVNPTGTLTASIVSPKTDQATSPPPAVITSDNAKADLANKQTQVSQLNQDVQSHQQVQQNNAAQQQATQQQAQANQKSDVQTQTPSLDDHINSLLNDLSENTTQIQNSAQKSESGILDAQSQNLIDQNTQYQQTAQKLQQIASGTYPLSPSEQNLLSATAQSYQQVIQAQQTANQAYTGQMAEAMASLGISTSAPTQAIGNIQATINSGNSKIAEINGQMAQALSTLQQGFEKQDFDMIQTSWQDAAKQFEDRNSTLQNMLSSVQAQAKAQVDEQQQYASTAITAITNSANFDYKQKQDAVTNALAQATLDERTKDDIQKNWIAEFTAGMVGGGSGGSNSGVPSATLGADGKVDPATQSNVYNAYVQTYGQATADLLKGLTDYSVNPNDWKAGATKGMSRATAVSLAKALDPTYDDSQYAIRAAYKKGLTSNASGSIGSAINSANKAVNHLTAYADTMSKVANGPLHPLNYLFNAAEIAPGRSADISQAKTEGLGVSDELAKFFKGSGTTDVQSIDNWQKTTSASATPGELKGSVQGAITLLGGQLETLSEQYNRTMGQPPPDNFLGASATANLSKLKNEGYQVDIPGILYTDKAAYIKSSPDAQANMTAAVSQLTAAGLPITPDNVLQLAQQQ